MSLKRLRKRRNRRVRLRKIHYSRYEKRRAKDQKVRAAYQLRKFRQQKRAIRKLTRLIEQEKDRLREARRIDWQGKTPLTFEPLLKAVRKALTVNGLYVTSTNGGTHSTTSWHYQNRAVDFGSNSSSEGPEIEAQELLLKAFGASYFKELFGPAGFWVKEGVIHSGTFPGHGDHLHVAIG